VLQLATEGEHHVAQGKGRFEIFQDYHLRVGDVTSDTAPPKEAPILERRFDETKVGNAKIVTLTEIMPEKGAVYLTLSRSGLTDSFNHYISHGAEFDQGVVHKLMGEEGLELPARDGKPRLVHVGVPGGRALEGAHPYFDIETTRDREAAPNLVKEFLGAWTSRFANPGYQSRSIKLDCGMIFWEKVPNNWIIKIETLPD
jgi:hypothetical protein